MPLGNFDKVTYVFPRMGKFTIRVKDPDPNDPDIITRKTDAGKTVHEKQYAFIDGFLEKIEYKEESYNGERREVLALTLKDTADTFLIRMSWVSRKAENVLYRLPNIAPQREIRICIGKADNDFIWILQDGEKVPTKYTKEEPCGLPPWTIVKNEFGEPIKSKGRIVYDRSTAHGFFKKSIREWMERKDQTFVASFMTASEREAFLNDD